MGRKRFVELAVDRIPLSDGDWIEVRRDLNTGEVKALESCGLKPPVLIGGRLYNPIDWTRHDFERAMIVITDWSIRDNEDKPVQVSMDAMKAMEPESFEEINSAVQSHLIARAAIKKQMRESQKKAAEMTLTEKQHKPQPGSDEPSSEPNLQ